MLHFLKLMLQLVLSPAKGWEDVAAGADTPRRTLRHGLLPLAALAGVASFTSLLYSDAPSVAMVVLQGVVAFVKYALTYFAGVAFMTYALSNYMGRRDEVNHSRVETFCAYSTGIMALIGVLEGLLPMELTLLQFLPLYVIVVMCYAREYLGVSEQQIFRLAGVATVSIVLPVYLIGMLMRTAM